MMRASSDGTELLRAGTGSAMSKKTTLITIDGAGPPRSPLPVGAVEGTAEALDVGA
jgi:hypothetical protein